LYLAWPDGSVLRVGIRSFFLNYYFAPSAQYRERISGLVGNFDGTTSNDIALSDGTVLEQPLDLNILHGQFADAHRVNDQTSLFIYDNGENTAFFTDRSFPSKISTLADFTEEQRNAAQRVCTDAGITQASFLATCTFDVAATGNNEFAELLPGLNNSSPSPLGFAFIDLPLEASGGSVSGSVILTEADNVGSLTVATRTIGSNTSTIWTNLTPDTTGAIGFPVDIPFFEDGVIVYELRSSNLGLLSSDIVIHRNTASMTIEASNPLSDDTQQVEFDFGTIRDLRNPTIVIFDEITGQAVTGEIPFDGIRLEDGTVVTIEDGVADFSGEVAGSFSLTRDRFPDGPGSYIVRMSINHRRSAGSVIFDLSTTGARVSFLQ